MSLSACVVLIPISTPLDPQPFFLKSVVSLTRAVKYYYLNPGGDSVPHLTLTTHNVSV